MTEHDKKDQSFDWEQKLASEGLGDIDADISGPSNDLAIIDFYGQNASGQLAILTVKSTIERYSDNTVGAAIAVHLTGLLAPELPLDGSLDSSEIDVVDTVTNSIQKYGLDGITLDDLCEVGGIDPEMGGLLSLFGMRDLIASPSPQTLNELREIAGKRLHEDNGDDLWDEDDDIDDYGVNPELYDDSEDDESEDSDADLDTILDTILLDESGEQFKI